MAIRDLAIYGFGGFGREVACIIKDINSEQPSWNLIGYIDDNVHAGSSNRYGEVLGGLDFLNNYPADLAVVIAIGSPELIKKLSIEIVNQNIFFPNIIAPSVFFFDKESVRLGQGNLITNSCRISCDVELGDFNIVNGSVSLGHDVKIGNYNVLFPDTRLSGFAELRNENFVGAKSFIAQNVKVGNNTKVSAGSFVMRDIRNKGLYAGNPARCIEVFNN